ncbi:MAG TPA: GH92 family glycosyl hydrolase [Flavitalea sp.]|nr:GH92 family glycosyl hydrolase [Flavitalea sp.]
MNYNVFSAPLQFIFAIILLSPSNGHSQSYTSFVDPLIGSGGHGHVFVGASVPFGALQLGPNNIYKGWDWCSGYNYDDSLIIGFSHTHLSGTGIGDLADILIMPYTGPVKTDKGTDRDHKSGYGSFYSHKNEVAKPGFYSVKLDDYNITAELTASERVGFHQYHFPDVKDAHVIIDLKEGINDNVTDSYIRQVDKYTLEGYRYSKGWAKDQWIYFTISLSAPIEKFEIYDNSTLLEGTSAKGKAIKGLLSFDRAPSDFKMKVGISPVSTENALANIKAEIPDWDFKTVVNKAQKKWDKELSKIDITTGSEKDKKIFYTSLYHTMINPVLYNDHNGDYRGTDKQVYKNASFQNYSVFSLWDTYRAANPLYTITQPARVKDMINSMLAIYDQQKKLPIWHLMGNETGTMVGIGSLQVIAEAYLKGIGGFDVNRAFDAIKSTAMSDSLGVMYIKNFKAIPSDKERRSVAKGLEYAIGDASIALMAKRMNKIPDADYFTKRGANYKLYFDNDLQFFKGKLSNGDWSPGFEAFTANNSIYAEGNAWQYLWLVPQDVRGLITLLGGEKSFNNKLDSLFSIETAADKKGLADITGTIGQYAHGNEPSHHICYLYAYSGKQWKTAEKVRHIMKEMYHDKPDGLIGNEDCGQMSAWYIFSSLGFYPVFPASEKYVIGSPLFNKATINLENGNRFMVEVTDNSDKNMYVQSMELNGKAYNLTYISHQDIIRGGKLKIKMGNRPNAQFGLNKEDRP